MLWLLHGNLGSPQDWEATATNLILPWKTINLWDLLSPSHPPLSLIQAGELLAQKIAQEDSNPHLCGYSLGGRLALHALIARPNLWHSCTLLGAHPGLTTTQAQQERIKKDEHWAQYLETHSWSDFYTAWNAQPVFRGGRNTSRPAPSSKDQQAMVSAFRTWSLGRQINLRSQLHNLQHTHTLPPLHLIVGEQDEKFTHLAQELTQELRLDPPKIIPHAGHRLLQDTPLALAQTLNTLIPPHAHGQSLS